MRKIKDRLVLGAIAGMVTSLPIQIFDALMHENGITDLSYAYSASRIFLTKKKTKTLPGKAVSAIVNFANSSTVATAITYILSLTGKDYALLKGAGIGTMMWVGIGGLMSSIGLKIKSKRPITPLILLGQHIIFGVMCSYIIIKLGDNSIFPDKHIQKQTKVPVIDSANKSN